MEKNNRLRIVTYNVFSFRLLKKAGIRQYSAALNELRPDILFLQEVDEGRVARYERSPVRELAELCGMHLLYHPVFNSLKPELSFGNAVLTRWPNVKIKEGFLPGRTWKTLVEPRGVLWTEMRMGDDKIQLLNTHLSFWPYQQRNQLRGLVREWILAAGGGESPLLLGGDLNLTPRSPALRLIPDFMKNATADNPLPTWSAKKPRRQLDYIFYNKHFELERAFLPEAPDFIRMSDHLPLAADLLYQGQGTK